MSKIYVNECKICGKRFPTPYEQQKYCSKVCRAEGHKSKLIQKGQLCWRCENACGGCSWSKNLVPVPGWKAKLVVIKDSEGDFSSYRIEDCPLFKEG